jgi:hypothetical protein
MVDIVELVHRLGAAAAFNTSFFRGCDAELVATLASDVAVFNEMDAASARVVLFGKAVVSPAPLHFGAGDGLFLTTDVVAGQTVAVYPVDIFFDSEQGRWCPRVVGLDNDSLKRDLDVYTVSVHNSRPCGRHVLEIAALPRTHLARSEAGLAHKVSPLKCCCCSLTHRRSLLEC